MKNNESKKKDIERKLKLLASKGQQNKFLGLLDEFRVWDKEFFGIKRLMSARTNIPLHGQRFPYKSVRELRKLKDRLLYVEASLPCRGVPVTSQFLQDIQSTISFIEKELMRQTSPDRRAPSPEVELQMESIYAAWVISFSDDIKTSSAPVSPFSEVVSIITGIDNPRRLIERIISKPKNPKL